MSIDYVKEMNVTRKSGDGVLHELCVAGYDNEIEFTIFDCDTKIVVDFTINLTGEDNDIFEGRKIFTPRDDAYLAYHYRADVAKYLYDLRAMLNNCPIPEWARN